MKRRDFGKVFSLGVAATVSANCEKSTVDDGARKTGKTLMHVGCQYMGTSVKELQFLKRFGVNNMDGPSGDFVLEEMIKHKEKAAKEGISFDMVHLDVRGPVVLSDGPERDRKIDLVCEHIRTASKAGIRGLNYYLAYLGVMRTESTPGRGGTRYSTWNYEKAPKGQLSKAGVISAELFWERITYFLERVIPVATEYKVQMACHPHDPGTPPGYRGVDRVMGTVEGLKNFIEISPSPYHGLNFCVGTVAEMLEDPGREIENVVRYFGERKKIFNVHFRNIRGRRGNFMEVYPDEGDMNFHKLMQVFRDVEYPYMLMPDHAPGHPDEAGMGRLSPSFAFEIGYIKAMIQAVNDEV